MARLADKLAIITGGARGLGAASAQALVEDGATVILADIEDEMGEAQAHTLRGLGHQAEYHHLDVRDAASWSVLIDKLMRTHGHVDVLVNNAGIYLPITIEDATAQQFRDILEIDLLGPFNGMKAVIPAMRQSGGGSIINICSNATAMIMPLASLYSATKAALANLSKTTAVHCAQRGYHIRVNSVHPGAHETQMLTRDAPDPLQIPMVRTLIKATPLGRLGRPDELGRVVAFLASDDASYITATEIFCDGGLSAVSFSAEPAALTE